MPFRPPAFTRILGRVTARFRPGRPNPPVDEWFRLAEQSVLDQVRAEVDPLVRALLPPSGSLLLDVVYDAIRGSLVLAFEQGRRIVLAVGDPRTAAELEAAHRLGGLKVMLVRCGVGLVAVEGLWEGQRLFLTGVPSSQ